LQALVAARRERSETLEVPLQMAAFYQAKVRFWAPAEMLRWTILQLYQAAEHS
jgi:hypothetical protein